MKSAKKRGNKTKIEFLNMLSRFWKFLRAKINVFLRWFSKNWHNVILPVVVIVVAAGIGLMIGFFVGSVIAFNSLIGA